jgi:hypothetical protein
MVQESVPGGLAALKLNEEKGRIRLQFGMEDGKTVVKKKKK